jgi:hypothetical protein
MAYDIAANPRLDPRIKVTCLRRRGCHGRLPQRGRGLIGARGCSVSCRLNDCISGLRWVVAKAAHLQVDPARIVVAPLGAGS